MDNALQISEQIKISATLAEGQFREFKSAYEGPPGNKIKRNRKDISRDVAEALVAFANADGGEILIGVEDDGKITGMDDFSEEEIDFIKKSPKNYVHKDTPLQAVMMKITKVDDKTVLYFRVSKGTRYIHLTSDGRCLKRNDLESIPVSADHINFTRSEVASMEYDRIFVDGVSINQLDEQILRIVADQISVGISIDKCLQYLGLAEYDAGTGLRLRRAAVLLFGTSPDLWHPRVQVRILRVNGSALGSGAAYNVTDDVVIKTNIVSLIDEAWEKLRPYLVVTRFQDDAKFRTTYIYPEVACREALVNAIAHRDYSEEGRGIEIYVYDDRIEVKNPGSLLSSISIDELKKLSGVHQSRNSYIARALREIGYMRELGEGMRRIFELMRSFELSPPEIVNESNSFSLTLHHRPMYTSDEALWLEQYDQVELSAEEKAVMLIGRRGDLIAPNDIIRRLGIVDTEHYRQIIASLQSKSIIETAINKKQAQNKARRNKVGVRDIPRFRVVSARDALTNSEEKKKGEFSSGVEKPESENLDEYRTKIYVANLPSNTTERELVSVFSESGEIASVYISKIGPNPKGFAFVQFTEPEAALEALGSSIFLGGRKLLIRKATPRRKRT